MGDDQTKFGDPTVYNIMFGPDKCGYTKRTHLIFQYKGKNVLKKSDLDYKQDGEGTSHLYRMVLKKDNTVLVEIDQEKIYEGSIKDDWEVLKPKKIDDPEDKKPSDWVEDSMMDDPEDKKPENWVEEKRVVDSSAKKPDDWDDEEDGEWEAPMIDNPDYHGDWSVKKSRIQHTRGSGRPRRLIILSMKMTTLCTSMLISVSLVSIYGRAKAVPFSIMLLCAMTRLKLMPSQPSGRLLAKPRRQKRRRLTKLKRTTTRRRRTRPMTMMTTRRTRRNRKTCKAFARFFEQKDSQQ